MEVARSLIRCCSARIAITSHRPRSSIVGKRGVFLFARRWHVSSWSRTEPHHHHESSMMHSMQRGVAIDVQVHGPFASGFAGVNLYEIHGTQFFLPERYQPIRGIGIGAYGVVWYARYLARSLACAFPLFHMALIACHARSCVARPHAPTRANASPSRRSPTSSRNSTTPSESCERSSSCATSRTTTYERRARARARSCHRY